MPEYEPPNAFYTQVSLPKYIKPEMFIGREGCHLKRMTELSGCDYLWYDFERAVIEVWGKERRLPKAVKMLTKRINSFSPPLPPLPPPPGNPPNEFKSSCKELQERLKVTTWELPPNVWYKIIGDEPDVMKFYFELLSMYPFNPYFTGIVSKGLIGGQFELVIKRSNTSD
jgi:hypothetical protein